MNISLAEKRLSFERDNIITNFNVIDVLTSTKKRARMLHAR